MVAASSKQDEASAHERQSIPHILFLGVTWILKGLLRVGIPMGPMILLTVRGRKSGKLRTTPVDLFQRGDRSFLVSTHRQESSNWVRNLRAAGEGTLTRGWNRRAIKAVELAPDAAGEVLKEVLGPRLASAMGGIVLRRTFLYHQMLPLMSSSARPEAIPCSRLSLWRNRASRCRVRLPNPLIALACKN